MEIYDLETFPITMSDGGYTTKIECPASHNPPVCMAFLKMLRHPTFTRAKIAIYQCPLCMKRWLGVGS